MRASDFQSIEDANKTEYSLDMEPTEGTTLNFKQSIRQTRDTYATNTYLDTIHDEKTEDLDAKIDTHTMDQPADSLQVLRRPKEIRDRKS